MRERPTPRARLLTAPRIRLLEQLLLTGVAFSGLLAVLHLLRLG
ncbi:MAG TPA: hypothetical protein VNR89_10680 [Roseomonas sp.]|nr:hypothetical protein [Roseomonas sp.]